MTMHKMEDGKIVPLSKEDIAASQVSDAQKARSAERRKAREDRPVKQKPEMETQAMSEATALELIDSGTFGPSDMHKDIARPTTGYDETVLVLRGVTLDNADYLMIACSGDAGSTFEADSMTGSVRTFDKFGSTHESKTATDGAIITAVPVQTVFEAKLTFRDVLGLVTIVGDCIAEGPKLHEPVLAYIMTPTPNLIRVKALGDGYAVPSVGLSVLTAGAWELYGRPSA